MCKGEITIFFYETPKSKDRVIHDSGLCFLYISAVNAKNHQMWLNSVCQHIPGVTECEQTQVESCAGIVKKLGKDLNVSHSDLTLRGVLGRLLSLSMPVFHP